MKIKYFKILVLILLIITPFTKNYAQDKVEEEARTVPMSDLIPSNIDAGLQKSTSTNNYGARSTSSSSTGEGGNADIGEPFASPFQLGADISGAIQNSINEVTGKVAFSVPLSAIASGPVSYSLSLGYNGQSAFKTGSELNKYSPVSTIGVGWSLTAPKIVVDNKQTTTREDDAFYIIDGSTNTKLICFNKESTYWEFKTEKFSNWVIRYYPGYQDTTINDSGNVVIIYVKTDYWSVIKDDGQTYIFGYSDTNTANLSQSKEVVSTWGNWIGDSNQNPTGVSTIVWNLSRINDQWNNYLEFKYELMEGRQNTSQVLYKHTEASYLKEIVSSKGAKITLNYENKNPIGTFVSEYYEPHKEQQEPDAYQERYEKKFLNSVEVFNTNNQLVLSFDFGHDIQPLNSSNHKRYLTSITQTTHNQGQSNSLPPQTFDYHYSGTYKGGLKKITYPSGGSATYNYQNKYVLNNGANKFAFGHNLPTGYNYKAIYVSDNYSLYVRRKKDPFNDGSYRFDFYRYWWNGKEWKFNRFQMPNNILDPGTVNEGGPMKDFYTVIGEDYYGFLYDKGTTADVYLFHKQKDGNWHYQTNSVVIGDGDPSFVSGNDFIGIGSHHNGKLYTYNWNGAFWRNNLAINQGSGQYYYAATNNFILSLDEDGGADMVTGTSHQDNYYIHYLDAEKKWQTKSWSAFADPRIYGIEKPSKFYPANSIAGFVAHDNPELFLRWDTHYNLTAVDNVLGWYDDRNSLVPVNNSMFTLVYHWFNQPAKAARFNGINWKVSPFSTSTDFYHVNFGLDLMTYKNEDSDNIMYKEYSPNSHSWVENNLNWAAYAPYASNAVNSEFIVAGKKIYEKTFQAPPVLPMINIGTLQYDNDFSYSDGLSHAFVKQHNSNNEFKKSSYYYINKETGFLSEINLDLKYQLHGMKKMGGRTPFMSPSSIWVRDEGSCYPSESDCQYIQSSTYLYRIIDDKFNQSVYDKVVGSIELDDDNGNVRKISYSYSQPNPSSNNDVVYYGFVSKVHRGFGSDYNGTVQRYFNTGSEDIQMAGLMLEEWIRDANLNLVKKTVNQWQKVSNRVLNSGGYHIDNNYNIRLLNNTIYEFGDPNIWNRTTYSYNSKAQISRILSQNSKEQQEQQEFRYAHEQYSFVRDKNILSGVYQTTTKNNNKVVDVKQNLWSNISNKVYITQKKSGSSFSNLRVDSNMSYVDTNGNLLEGNNGQNFYNTALLGYSNLYEVATIANAQYQEVVSELDVSYSQLQNLSTTNLKIELMKLYERLPDAMIVLTFYDDNGRVINTVNERKEESYMYYDVYGRLDYVSDGYGNVLERKTYNYGN